MSAEGEEDVTQQKNAGGAIADCMMRGEDEGTVCLLLKQYSAEKGSLIGSERFGYFFGNLPLPSCKGRCNDTEGDALAGDAAEVRDTVEGGVDAGGEQRVALLHCVERVTPLLNGRVTADLGRKRVVDRKLLVEEAIELFKGAKGAEKISGLECDRLKFKGGQRHDAFLFQI